MFDFALAALLRVGVTEDKLPRTHSGVIAAFRSHAVQSGQIDRQLATQLSRTESLRIKADYTGTEIELSEAKEVVQNAKLFVRTVERVFSRDTPSLAKEYENRTPQDDDKVSEPTVAVTEIQRKRSTVSSRWRGRLGDATLAPVNAGECPLLTWISVSARPFALS